MHSVIIVGSGFSGLGMAIALKKAGRHDFVILEKDDDLGGTWRDNTYPGCACDIPSHLYSFSFAPHPGWSRMYPRQQEIWDYLRRCADRYELRPHIRYGVEVNSAEWDEGAAVWRLGTKAGDSYVARAVVLGVGALHVPAYPQIPGVERFTGPAFHSSRWDHGLDLTGKRVAVIGTGASAIQFVPPVAEQAARLDVYQRTPPWVIPKPDRRITDFERRLFRAAPGTQRLYRTFIYWRQEAGALGFVHPRLMGLAATVAKWHLKRQVPDPRMRAALTPDYTIGCKRILISDDYYPALARSNVDLITTDIREITPTGVVDATGAHREVDVIIYGTGFRVTDAWDGQRITGRGGESLVDRWHARGIETYMGITVAGFPNAFLLLGPNTGLGHNSVVLMIEAQIRYVLQALARLDHADTIEVRPEVQRAFNARIQRQLRGMVWNAGGCKSWYLDENGVNRVIWPGATWRYRLRTRRLDPRDYDIRRSAVPAQRG